MGAPDATPGGFDPVAFLAEAVGTPSHEDVAAMRSLLVDAVEANGVGARVDAAGNVLATRGGGAPHVVLNTHVDTVAPHVPFARDREAGVIRGRGACDAKGPLAALLAAFLSVDPSNGRVTLAVTPDEETLSTGAAALTGVDGGGGSLDGDLHVVGEPTGLDVCHAARGRFQGAVSLVGTSAHAADPGAGRNAVAAAEDALRAIRTFDAAAAARHGVDGVWDAHPELGAATLTPTTIAGGEAENQVPADCRIVVDRRSVPPETADGFRRAFAAHLDAVVEGADVEFALTDRDTPFLGPFETPPDHDLVETLAAAARAGGRGGAVRPFGAATEAAYFAPAPTVVFGPGDLVDDEGAVAHAQREYVRVAEVEAAADAVTEALRALVG